MYPNSMPAIMILAQAVIQIFCSQYPLWVICLSLKRGIILLNIHRILWKVNQIICIMYPNSRSMPDIMILAQVVLQIFCWQGCIGLQYISWKRGIIQSYSHRILWKINQVICFMYPNSMPAIMILAQAVLQIFCWQDCFTIQDAEVGKGK